MRTTARTLAAVLAAALVAALAGCSGLDYMIEEYNSRFGIHDDSVLYPGDIGYDERNMIESEYHVYGYNSLNIPAPQSRDATYRWELFKRNEQEQLMVMPLTQEEQEAQTLKLQFLNTRFGVGTYQLRLTVRVGDKTYVDTALVSIHLEEVG